MIGGGEEKGDIPLTYFLRSSRFICSARSIMGGWASWAAGREGCGVPFAEEGMAEAGRRRGEGTGLWALASGFDGGTTRGEAAMMLIYVCVSVCAHARAVSCPQEVNGGCWGGRGVVVVVGSALSGAVAR